MSRAASAKHRAHIQDLRAGVVKDLFRQYVPEESVEEQWDGEGLQVALKADLERKKDKPE